jgi:hypothetical protein
VVSSFAAIAAGNVGQAANSVEKSLSSVMKVALNVVAKLTKIDKFVERIKGAINSVTSRIHKFVDPIIDKAVTAISRLLPKTGVKPTNPKAANVKNIKATEETRAPKIDSRTKEQKQQAVNDAARDADALMTAKTANVESVKKGLVPIKEKYKLNTIDLVLENDGEYHVTAKINPEASTPSRRLKPKAHTEFRIVKEHANAQNNGKLTMKYETATGSTFSVTVAGNTPKADIETVTGEKLALKGWKGITGRGTLNKAKDMSGYGLDAAHVIADQFLGSGYRPANNIIYTSAVFNQNIMAGTEKEIFDFVTDAKTDNSKVASFDITAQVAWDSLKDSKGDLHVPDDLVKKLKADLEKPQSTHYKDMENATEDEIRKEITARLEQLKDKLKRCRRVTYAVTIRDVAGTELGKQPFFTSSSDIWLGLKPHWLK